jgi:NhaP-type Na+/H+ or K+/H+ antiporter
MTGHLELWVLGLLAAVAGLVMLSNRLGVPYPVFLVLGNSVLFILIGLQLPNILESISDENSMMWVVLYAALVSLAVIGTRLLWTFPATYLPRYLSRSVRERNPSPP